MTRSIRFLLTALSLGLGFACTTVGPDLNGNVRVYQTAEPTSPEVCSKRRVRTANELWNGILILESGDEPEHGRFQPDDDFFWLTGIDAPEAAVVLVASEGDLKRQTLYLPPKDERHELWNGPRLSPGPTASKLSGFADIRSTESFLSDVEELQLQDTPLLTSGMRVASYSSMVDDDGEPMDTRRFMRNVQVVKDSAEIEATRAAVDITQEALADAMRIAVPGAYEFTAEAAIEGGFRFRGAETLAFPSICGSGINSCYLHYRSNQRRLQAGDLLLMDVGAKVRHYCADVTRTIPVSGTFTPRQREVYTIVYEASRLAADVLKPGATLNDADKVARDYLAEHGFERKDFPHSIGHGLGLKVHDSPARTTTLEAGMVVTIEPGIYLPDEEIGIRIEDDYLITETGAELLSSSLPSHPDELEAFLAEVRGS